MTSSAPPTVCYVSAKTFSPCRGAHRRPDRGGGRDRLRDVRQDPRLPGSSGPDPSLRLRAHSAFTERPSPSGWHDLVSSGPAHPHAPASSTRSKGASHGCSIRTPIARSRSSSASARKDTAAASTILRDYVRRVRQPKLPVYLKLHFAPGLLIASATIAAVFNDRIIGLVM